MFRTHFIAAALLLLGSASAVHADPVTTDAASRSGADVRVSDAETAWLVLGSNLGAGCLNLPAALGAVTAPAPQAKRSAPSAGAAVDRAVWVERAVWTEQPIRAYRAVWSE